MKIEKIKPQQVETLADLCRQIYQESYPYLWDDAGKWYMETRYNVPKLLAEIENPNAIYSFVYQDNNLAGHLKLNLDSDAIVANTSTYGNSSTLIYDQKTAEEIESKAGLEVERIYFLNEHTGKGLGQRTLDWVFDLAQKKGKDYVWLHCMDSSPAQAFYKKYGFEICGETALPFELMKPQYRRMWKMWKKVEHNA